MQAFFLDKYWFSETHFRMEEKQKISGPAETVDSDRVGSVQNGTVHRQKKPNGYYLNFQEFENYQKLKFWAFFFRCF